MADTTSHDTIGASTLAAPSFLSPSPSPSGHPPMDSPDHILSPVSSPKSHRSRSRSPPSFRDSSLDRAARELDARLAEYTVDFDQFPGGHGPDDALPDLEDEADRLSAVGGPEDFTANLERYLLGDDDPVDQDEVDDKDKDRSQPQSQPEAEIESDSELPQPHDATQPEHQPEAVSHQPAVEDEAELGEYSEFGPPVDMSTPSHLLRRTAGLARDVTHLENIEEGSDDEPSTAATPIRKPKSPVGDHEKHMEDDLRRQIAELVQAVRDRDEQLEKSRKRVLEAASAGEQIKHLQGELQKKTALLEELHGEEYALRRSSINASDFSALQKQIADMQKDLQSRNSQADIDAERLDTISMLRQQLSLTQEQLKKRDATLDETLAKLKEVTAAKELQLREKNGEIDRLRSKANGQSREIEKLEAELSRARRDYRVLEDQMVLLETKNRPLEEKNSTLEADLTRAQSQVTAQENALKAMAADLPLETAGNTYTEILELIKDLGQSNTNNRPAKLRDTGDGDADGNQELEQIRGELERLRVESSETTSAMKTLELQLSHAHDQAAESQLLIQSIEAENTRLTKRAEELKSSLDKANSELNTLRAEHTKALETIDRLQHETEHQTQSQQPSPPPTPLKPTQATITTTTLELEETHKAQIASLKTAHATALSTLRSAHADSTRKLRSLLSAAENRESALRAELDSHVQKQHDEDQTREKDIRSLRAEIKRLHSVIAVKDETAAAMDQRIAKSVEKREAEWERRVDLLLKERERMGRALLWTLGEKELGEGGKENQSRNKNKNTNRNREDEGMDEAADGKRRQAYRYKYVRRS